MAFRNDDSDALADANGTGRDGYTDGEPGVTPPTPVRDQDLNMIQEEICRTVEGSGVALTSSRDGEDQVQLLRAIHVRAVGQALCQSHAITTLGAETLNDAAWGGTDGRTVVFVANGGDLYGGDDTSNFGIQASMTSSEDLRGVAWSASLGMFAVVGDAGSVWTSTNGINWVEQMNATSSDFHQVIWVESLTLFVAVGTGIETSPDGVNWTARTADAASLFLDIAWSESLGLLCAVGTSGSIETSPDGVTWTARTAGSSYSGTVYSVAWSDYAGRFIIGVDAAGSGALRVQSSDDGITWTQRTVDTDKTTGITRVEAFQDVFCAAAEYNRWVSSDGITWYGMAFSGDLFDGSGVYTNPTSGTDKIVAGPWYALVLVGAKASHTGILPAF